MRPSAAWLALHLYPGSGPEARRSVSIPKSALSPAPAGVLQPRLFLCVPSQLAWDLRRRPRTEAQAVDRRPARLGDADRRARKVLRACLVACRRDTATKTDYTATSTRPENGPGAALDACWLDYPPDVGREGDGRRAGLTLIAHRAECLFMSEGNFWTRCGGADERSAAAEHARDVGRE